MIDFNKPVQTRDGRKVRILCTDRASDMAVVGLVAMDHCDKEELHSWHLSGARHIDMFAPLDLINVPERVDQWFNLYRHEAGMAFDSKRESIEAGSPYPPHMLALVKVTFEDGKPVAVALEDCK